MTIKIVKRGPVLKELVLARLEKRLGQRLPAGYREFMLKFNGGEPESNSFSVAAIGEAGINVFFSIRGRATDGDLETEIETTKGRMPSTLIPIADAEGGNLLCLCMDQRENGSIYYWDHEEETHEDEGPTRSNLYKIADSFGDFWKLMEKFDPSEVELKEGQVEEIWIEPGFLESLKEDEENESES